MMTTSGYPVSSLAPWASLLSACLSFSMVASLAWYGSACLRSLLLIQLLMGILNPVYFSISPSALVRTNSFASRVRARATPENRVSLMAPTMVEVTGMIGSWEKSLSQALT